jgi:hypothetical protein
MRFTVYNSLAFPDRLREPQALKAFGDPVAKLLVKTLRERKRTSRP